jgi:hypothetical protein
VRKHGLLKRGERSRLDDVGRDGAAERGDQQRRERAGEREHAACGGHENEQEPVAAASPDTVAVASDQYRDGSCAAEQGGEDGADRGVGEAAAGEGNPDQDRAEPVGERARRLGGDDLPRVGAQLCSSKTAAPPLAGQNT